MSTKSSEGRVLGMSEEHQGGQGVGVETERGRDVVIQWMKSLPGEGLAGGHCKDYFALHVKSEAFEQMSKEKCLTPG